MITPEPLCAYDIDAGGVARPVGDLDTPPGDGAYRWMHFDLASAGLEPWLRARLPGASVDALLQSETRPRCDGHEGGVILNLRGMNLNPGADPEDMVSLRLWICDRLIVSVRVRKIWAVDALRQRAEHGKGATSLGGHVAAITDGLTRRIEEVTLKLEDEVDALEEQVLESDRVEVSALSIMRHTVIKLRRFVNPQREALGTLAAGRFGVIDDDARAALREIANRSVRNVEALDALRERLIAMQDHVDVQRSQAMARNSYVLSIVAAIFLPLGFLTGLFGVNVAGMPGVEAEFAFWTLCGLSAVLGVALFLIFKFSKWL